MTPITATLSTAALGIEDLRKSYGTLEVLRGVSFELLIGEQVALLGPNGAGKTTLVRCICGLTRPNSGKICLQGKPITAQSGREAIGLVPQEIALYQDLSAEENLTAFGRFHGLRGMELKQRVEWALVWTGLEEQRKVRVQCFSGGMKRRVNIACGVLHRPSVLLLDEPTVGVDPQSRQRIFAMLSALREEGTSILLTTHHLDEAESQCDRIVIMDRGSVAAQGTISELVQQTIGNERHVRMRVTEPLASPIEGWQFDTAFPGMGKEQLTTRVEDVARQLPLLLQKVTAAGYSVAEVEVHAPSLHHVFLHLTGNQLRDT